MMHHECFAMDTHLAGRFSLAQNLEAFKHYEASNDGIGCCNGVYDVSCHALRPRSKPLE